MKKCTKCGNKKDVTEFCKRRSTKDGLDFWCKKCRFKINKANREKKFQEYPIAPNIKSLKGEEWKDVVGYEGIYQVSNLGRIKKLSRIHKDIIGRRQRENEKLKEFWENSDGYSVVQLSKENKGDTFRVHRLVAIAFIPNPLNLPQVNHKKEFEKDNNKVDNLEWCTGKYNCNYGTHIERVVEKISKKVYQYDLQYNFIKEWKSASECGRNGFINSNICACCNNNGINKTHKGYIWSYTKLTNE